MRRISSICFGLVLLALGACTTGPDNFPTSPWSADIGLRDRVLVMTLLQEESMLSGTGYLARLDSPTSESLVLSGTRVADTVDITFHRQGGAAPFRFAGWYISNGTLLRGVLDGAEFSAVNLTFRRR